MPWPLRRTSASRPIGVCLMPCIRRRWRIQAAAKSPIHCYPPHPPDFADNINFTPSDRVVNLIAVQTTPVNASIYIRATTATEQATLVLQLAAVDPPAIVAALVNALTVLLTGEDGRCCIAVGIRRRRRLYLRYSACRRQFDRGRGRTH